eukprot:3104548-Alexandrium_andersonii.AAC.1
MDVLDLVRVVDAVGLLWDASYGMAGRGAEAVSFPSADRVLTNALHSQPSLRASLPGGCTSRGRVGSHGSSARA